MNGTAGLLLIIFILIFENGRSLKCYQCRSDKDKECGSSVNAKWAKDCPKGNTCRKISQMLLFKDEESWTSIRECATSEESGSSCYFFKWKKLAKQEICECNVDSCNSGNTHTRNVSMYTLISLLWMFHYLNTNIT